MKGISTDKKHYILSSLIASPAQVRAVLTLLLLLVVVVVGLGEVVVGEDKVVGRHQVGRQRREGEPAYLLHELQPQQRFSALKVCIMCQTSSAAISL